MAEETRKKILKLIEELDYKPNIIARRLVSKKKYVFAILIPEPTEDNPYWSLHEPGISKAEAELSPLGIFVERFLYDQGNPKSYLSQAKKIINGNYDAVIAVPFFKEESFVLLDHCKSKNIPYIFFDTNLLLDKYSPLSYIGQDAFQSGQLAGNLFSYILGKDDVVLAVSINAVKKADNHVNYLQREEGLKKFAEKNKAFNVKLFHFSNPADKSDNDLEEKLLNAIKENKNIKAVFVTNSRAYRVAKVLEKSKINDLTVLGYDLVEANVDYMKKGYIDFLISQEPYLQGYRGIMSLYEHLILNQKVSKGNPVPITVIMPENLDYYLSGNGQGHLPM